MSSSATSSSSSSRIYAQPLEDVVRVATLGRSSFGANLAKVSSLLQGEGFISITANALETTCVGSSDLILSHFGGASSLADVNISHTWRVFRVDSDGELWGSDDGAGGSDGERTVVENVSERLGKAGISCYYTASIEADFVLVSEDEFDRACGILVDRRDSISYSDVYLPEEEYFHPEHAPDDTVEIVRQLGSGEDEHDHPLGSASTLDADNFSALSADPSALLQSVARKRSCPEIGFLNVSGRPFGGVSPPMSPSMESFSSFASRSSMDSLTFAQDDIEEDAQPTQSHLSFAAPPRYRRASSSAATALLSAAITPRHASPIQVPPTSTEKVTLHPSQLSMVKLQPSSSRRHDTALDAVQLFLTDIASGDFGTLPLGCASFFSVVKDEGALSVTGDPLLMGKRFDEVTDDALREAREAVEEQLAEDAQRAAAALETRGGGGHRRAMSCPPAGSYSGSDSSDQRRLDWESELASSVTDEDEVHVGDAHQDDSGTILRCLQVRLPTDEGFSKSGILRKYSNLLSANSIPMVYHSTASFANILVPKKDLALARQILEQA